MLGNASTVASHSRAGFLKGLQTADFELSIVTVTFPPFFYPSETRLSFIHCLPVSRRPQEGDMRAVSPEQTWAGLPASGGGQRAGALSIRA